MKRFLSILTVALFTFAAVPSFAEEPADLYPAPPAEKSVNSAPKHKKIHKAKKAKKVTKRKARHVRKARH
ncbi:MAG TPA: hypothetical protein VMV75_04430 [Sulfuricella sp.]|nr:hypothetical protein [Sulfuricella sp.]